MQGIVPRNEQQIPFLQSDLSVLCSASSSSAVSELLQVSLSVVVLTLSNFL